MNLKFEAEYFDRSISTCVLHHLIYPETALIELRRVTRVNGLISLYVPSDPGFVYKFFQKSQNKKIKLALIRNNLNVSVDFFRATEHRGNVYSFHGFIMEIFKNDQIKITKFPAAIENKQLNFFSVYNIRRS